MSGDAMRESNVICRTWFVLGLALAGGLACAQTAQQSPGPGVVPVVLGGTPAGRQGDRAASLLSNSSLPVYPELLRRVGIEGEVQAKFVVDTLGHVEPASFTVVQVTVDLSRMRGVTSRLQAASEPDTVDEMAARVAFTEAVRRAIAGMQFVPAEAGGHRVRQLVEEPFDFRLR